MANMSQSWGHPWPCAPGAHPWRTTPLLLTAPEKASCLSSKPLGLTLTLKSVGHPGLMHPHIHRSSRGTALVRSQSYSAGQPGGCLLDKNPFMVWPTCHPQNRLSLFFLCLLSDALFSIKPCYWRIKTSWGYSVGLPCMWTGEPIQT